LQHTRVNPLLLLISVPVVRKLVPSLRHVDHLIAKQLDFRSGPRLGRYGRFFKIPKTSSDRHETWHTYGPRRVGHAYAIRFSVRSTVGPLWPFFEKPLNVLRLLPNLAHLWTSTSRSRLCNQIFGQVHGWPVMAVFRKLLKR